MTLAHDLIDVVIVIAVGPGLWQQLWPAAYIFFGFLFLLWPDLSEKPITTIKHIYTTMHNNKEHCVAMNCIVAIFLYGFMRFGIEFQPESKESWILSK